jgi:hypothetical protein
MYKYYTLFFFLKIKQIDWKRVNIIPITQLLNGNDLIWFPLKTKYKTRTNEKEIDFLTGVNYLDESSRHFYAYVAAYTLLLLFGAFISMVSLVC